MIRQLSKEITCFEKMFLGLDERCQFAVEVSKPDLIPKIIRNFQNHILGFHLKVEDSKMIYHENPIEIYPIPKSVKNVRDACNFVNSIRFDINKTLSVIAANDNTVAISAHHMICDGGLIVEAFDKLLLDEPCKLISKIPLTVCDMFSNELKNLSKDEIIKANHSLDNITKIKWSKNYEELKKQPGIQSICRHIEDESPATDFQFYKSKMNLTDSYMTSYLLAIMSLNGQIDSNYGINIPINLRQFIPKNERNFSNTQNSSFIIANALNVDPKVTIRQLAKLLRQDLLSKINKVTPLAIYQCLLDDSLSFNHKFCAYPEMSNIGPFKSDYFNNDLIDDLWVQSSSTHPAEDCIFIIAFSKMKNGKNILCSRLRQPCAVLNDTDANLMMKSFLHMMKEVPPDVSIQSAYDDLRSFQKNILKNNKHI